MITVAEAEQIIGSKIRNWGRERIPLSEALNRILAEDIRADRDFPPFTRVSMDGIAIRFDQFENGRRIFPVSGLQAAGAPPLKLSDPTACVEVMTGAMIPEGADTVIRYEDIDLENGMATIRIEDVRRQQNAHGQGTDRKEGDILLPAGTRIGAPEVGILATVGVDQAEVFRLPEIAIVSTGDELVPVTQRPLPYQIRQSNGYSIQSLLAKFGFPSERLHLPDDQEELRKQLKELLINSDILILTGGVSKGKFDFLPDILSELGVRRDFHRVQQRPGKPFWFGSGPEDQLTFALPGNPVSSFMCSRRYVLPFLQACYGLPGEGATYARLAEAFHFRPDLTYFLQVRLECTEDGYLLAHPIPGRGSGDLANLSEADGFLELPAGRDQFQQGEVFPYYSFR